MTKKIYVSAKKLLKHDKKKSNKEQINYIYMCTAIAISYRDIEVLAEC